MTANRKRLTAIFMAFAIGACFSNGNGKQSGDAISIAAEVNGRQVTLAEIDERIAGQLYEARTEALEARITELVVETEAEQRGMSPQELVESEARELGAVSDAEVEEFFEQNRARMRPDETLENVRAEVRRFLEDGREQAAIDALRDAAAISIRLEPPRIDVIATGPSRGPADAAVTIIEFSDYQCPFCSRAEPAINQVLDLFPEDVRLVYRHFPIDSIHPRARPAAIAAVCAEEQGQFWEFHKRVFENQRNLSDDALAGFADDLELDRAAYDACIAGEAAAARVAEDLAAGQEAGTTGTPAFYVNGILLSGARPVQDFVDLIDAELDRQEGGS